SVHPIRRTLEDLFVELAHQNGGSRSEAPNKKDGALFTKKRMPGHHDHFQPLRTEGRLHASNFADGWELRPHAVGHAAGHDDLPGGNWRSIFSTPAEPGGTVFPAFAAALRPVHLVDAGCSGN